MRPFLSRLLGRLGHLDRVLLLSLALAFAFSMQGINWGRVECWNADEMALRGLSHKSFTKPPFHTFLSFIVVVGPIKAVEAITRVSLEHSGYSEKEAKDVSFDAARLLGVRFFALALFLGSVILMFEITRGFFGLFAARVVALLFSTSAGFIAFNNYLTADSPMIFWMLLAVLYSQKILFRNLRKDYLLAGLYVGLATATKYNGLAVGILIPVAHLMRFPSRAAFFDIRIFLGLLMVPAGFFLACPYALINWSYFVSDFMYNYAVTPHYGGQTGYGYLDFLRGIPKMIGWPCSVWAAAAMLIGLVAILARKVSGPGAQGFLLLSTLVVLYYVKIGAFSRIETRFVMPVVPFLLVMTGAFLQMCERRPLGVCLSLAPVVLYNCICSFEVGVRFTDDPRMAAQTWVKAHIPEGSSIESSKQSPDWNKLPGVHLKAYNAPNLNERGLLFKKIFSGNKWVMNKLAEKEGHVNEDDFTLGGLQARNPDYMAVDSTIYESLGDQHIKTFYLDLIAGRYPYDVIFDLESPPVAKWIYPKSIDFLHNRMTILQRRAAK